jgi:hypothetical protein
MNVGLFQRPGVRAGMANAAGQVLFAQVISHLLMEFETTLAAGQLTGRLSQARDLAGYAAGRL